MRDFHSEDLCMKKTLDHLKYLCVQNNISLPQDTNISDDEEHTEEDEIFLHAILSSMKAYLIDSRASNHMVSSRKYSITFPLSRGPSRHMGDDSKIPNVERGSDKIQHDEFMPSSTTNKNFEDEEEAELSTQSIRIEESLLEVTPSPDAPEVYEISDISSPQMDDPEEDI